MESKLVQALENIRNDLNALNPDDHDAVVDIGAELEEFITAIPDEMMILTKLIELCLEGLQTIYQNAAKDNELLVNVITAAASAAVKFLQAEENSNRQSLISEAARLLLSTLNRDPNEWLSESTPKIPSQQKSQRDTLDDAAALLVQIEPNNTAALSTLKEMLGNVANQDSLAKSARKFVRQAAQKVDEIIRGHSGRPVCLSDEPEKTLAEVGRLIEAAMKAAENSKTSKLPESTPSSEANLKSHLSSASNLLPADADPDLLGEFITESREYVENAEAALLYLESDPEDVESLNTVFRAFHTIKGTSAFLEINPISELAHRAESLLSSLRDRETRYTDHCADLALRSVDMIKELLQNIENTLSGEPVTMPEGFDDLMRLLDNPEMTNSSTEAPSVEHQAQDSSKEEADKEGSSVEQASSLLEATGKMPVPPAGLSTMAQAGSLTCPASPSTINKSHRRSTRIVESSVRVPTDRLDKLIDMVGELVIAHSMVAQDEIVTRGAYHKFSRKVTHTGKIVRELQDLSMSMRMVPLKATFQKMARLARDLAHKSHKVVNFIAEGGNTEIDRNMVDLISDPLVHMVRNALDHGIEPPEIREANGKPRAGTVRLSAHYFGSSVMVELKDDGRGLDRNKIIEEAISKGLIDSNKGMSDNEVFNLIFLPGFSTADKVTAISGRGVGMDVVKRGVETLRGRIDIFSEAGKGTTFTICLPLTLAITDGMLVKVGDERYIVPTVSIYMSFRPELSALSTVAGRGEMVMLRGELIPIVRLHRLFGIEGAIEDPTKGLLVIVIDGSRRYALLVDELLGQRQMVAKSLGSGLCKVPGISGGAILGDGRVGLILDTAGVLKLANGHTDFVEQASSLLEAANSDGGSYGFGPREQCPSGRIEAVSVRCSKRRF